MMLRGARPLLRPPFGGARLGRLAFQPIAPVKAPLSQRGALVVVAAAKDDKDKKDKDKKVEKKRTPFAEKRAMIAVQRRMYNKARKSACATSIKKVIKLSEDMVAASPKVVPDVKALEELIGKAFCTIDKAVSKGILHKNNGARKKARCSRYKRKVLVSSNLWVPPPDHPDHRLWLKLQPKKVAAQGEAAVPATQEA